MSTEIKAPVFPESVADGEIATWHKQPGEAVLRDELLVDIETDKVVLEVVAPADGALSAILKEQGDTILSGEVIGQFEVGGGSASEPAVVPEASEASAPIAEAMPLSPAVRKLVDEKGLDASTIPATGKGGRLTKEDVQKFIAQPTPAVEVPAKPPAAVEAPQETIEMTAGARVERRVPMTRLRSSIAKRLVSVQQNSAMLTTFNEVNMEPIMKLRNKYKAQFEKAHDGTRLGFMSFFVQASIEALKLYPEVNASIDGNDVVYHGYQDMGVAVSTDRGLVVPVLRDAHLMGMAEIEEKINEYGKKARDNKLTLEEMQGGTFTISNGGVFGSLLSTPILNPPQTAILGMHKIQERPMVVDGEIVIQPMMYLALSYDHRMIDGKAAVQFLVTIKDFLEDPARILLKV
ncbi:MAG: 2-oxoglutarate dehydrogenase complex dihydrolipoyllysine-residue succinyltransferase [Pseudomonadales bacterium]|nr:2-oxoglutarate dehydrogenase complex dihydrolipoyllysine-residue succinyltransferase [Pseudomonadales bacterium]